MAASAQKVDDKKFSPLSEEGFAKTFLYNTDFIKLGFVREVFAPDFSKKREIKQGEY